MNDDFNTPILIAHLFEAVRIVNSAKQATNNLKKKIYNNSINYLTPLYSTF